jgi:hypothetical protein
MTKIANPLIIIKKVSGGGSSVDTARIFSGATKPLTYKGMTDNVFNYTSNDYNLTLSGLDSVATISGNGTKSVSVTFNVSGTSNTTTTFTFTCTKENETLTFEGTAFYYGTELGDGNCLAVAETLSGTPLAVSYTFIESSSLPLFGSITALWNSVYSYQIQSFIFGKWSGTSIGAYFLYYCYSFNQPTNYTEWSD